MEKLRPARESCESCHWPEKFYEGKLREIKRYAEDESNTEDTTVLLMKTGGPGGGGRWPAIHWHVHREIFYIATDDQQRNIPWVSVKGEDGSTVVYVSTLMPLSPEQVERSRKTKVDCVLCHNRATHVFRQPREALDEALAAGRVDRSLPYIKRQGLALLTAPYGDDQAAMMGITTLENFSREWYPAIYARSKGEILRAIEAIQEIYRANVFPSMKVIWGTYPNNLSHEGCFRCHDGKHTTNDGKTIITRCDACHDILSFTRKAG